LLLCLFHFRLNGGFGAGFLLNAFGFSAPSFSSFVYMTFSLPTESWLQSRLLIECIRLCCSLDFFFLFISVSFCLLVLLLRLCRLTFRLNGGIGPAVSRLSTECIRLCCFLSLLCLSVCLFDIQQPIDSTMCNKTCSFGAASFLRNGSALIGAGMRERALSKSSRSKTSHFASVEADKGE
jgi:hypothetical protein